MCLMFEYGIPDFLVIILRYLNYKFSFIFFVIRCIIFILYLLLKLIDFILNIPINLKLLEFNHVDFVMILLVIQFVFLLVGITYMSSILTCLFTFGLRRRRFVSILNDIYSKWFLEFLHSFKMYC